MRKDFYQELSPEVREKTKKNLVYVGIFGWLSIGNFWSHLCPSWSHCGLFISVGLIPATATSMKFNWSNDSFNGECVFKITSPKGNVVANVSTPSPGPIKLDLCLE